MRNLIVTTVIVLALIAAYRFRIFLLAGLKRFDQSNIEKRAAEIRDRADNLAHFRHTISRAGEQVEDIGEIEVVDERTGETVTRYLFEGEQFATRREAEQARVDAVRDKARAFYTELPQALAARGTDKLKH